MREGGGKGLFISRQDLRDFPLAPTCQADGRLYSAKPYSAKPYSAIKESTKPYSAKPHSDKPYSDKPNLGIC